MCQLTPEIEIRELEWAVKSLVELHESGSSEREICKNATTGIVSRLRWVGEQIKLKEGKP